MISLSFLMAYWIATQYNWVFSNAFAILISESLCFDFSTNTESAISNALLVQGNSSEIIKIILGTFCSCVNWGHRKIDPLKIAGINSTRLYWLYRSNEYTSYQAVKKRGLLTSLLWMCSRRV